MKKRFIKLYLFILILVFSTYHVFTLDKIDDLSFVETEITQVLKTIAEVFEITIVPENNVTGKVTRYFKDTTLEETLTLLLEPLGFTYEVKENIYFVKKIPLYTVDYEEDTKLFTINSKKGRIQNIVFEMSQLSKETIDFRGDYNDNITIYIHEKDVYNSLKMIADSKEYQLKREGNMYALIKEETFDDDIDGKVRFHLKGTEESISIKLKNQSSNDVIIKLFNKYKKKMSLLSKKSVKIPYLSVSNITFDDLLDAISQHSGQTWSKIDDVYYIYDSLKSSQVNSYRISASYKLKNLDYKTFVLNVPSQIVPQSSYKIDAENNTVTLFGSPKEVEEYLNYIRNIDDSKQEYSHRIFKLKNIDVKKIKNYIPEKYKKMPMSIFEDQNMFSIYLDNYDYAKLNTYINTIDILTTNKYAYKFKYLKPDDVLKSMLPKNIQKDQVFLNVNEASLIFETSEEVKNQLFKYLDSIDKPIPVIRYQLLIVEYINTNTFVYDWGFGIKKGNLNELSWEAGVFNGTDSIKANFDIPTVFGHYFSVHLENKLRTERAKIQMSTEIYGISGETVTLTNTQTWQYKDTIKDADNNTETPVYSSTTFGLNLEIKGRATSNSEVFIEVNARVSDQLPSQSEGSSAPNTSEKTVKNSVRTSTGKPIVLGGLITQKENIANNKIPGLGDIPFLGNLFKTHNNQYSNSEFVIYIIPFIQKSEEELRKEREQYIKQMYEYFVEKK